MVILIVVFNLVVVLISIPLQKTLVAGRVVGGAWGGTHVGGIFFVGGRALLLLRLGVLIEATEWNREDLVVEKGSEDQEDEAEDSLPVEGLKSEKAAHDPDDEGSARVDGGSLGGGGDLGGGDSAHVEASDREHHSEGEPYDRGCSLHLGESVRRVLQVVEVAKCASALDGLHNWEDCHVIAETPHALSANHLHWVKVVVSKEVLLNNEHGSSEELGDQNEDDSKRD